MGGWAKQEGSRGEGSVANLLQGEEGEESATSGDICTW